MFTHFSQWLNELHAVPAGRAGSCPGSPRECHRLGSGCTVTLPAFPWKSTDLWHCCCSVALVEAPRWIRVSSCQGPELSGGAHGGLGPLLSWACNCLYCGVIVYTVLDFLTPYDLFASMKRINFLLWASFCTESQLDALERAVTCGLAQAPVADRQARAALFWVYCCCFVRLPMAGGTGVGSFWLANYKFTLVRLQSKGESHLHKGVESYH